jgi:hypothetical protein
LNIVLFIHFSQAVQVASPKARICIQAQKTQDGISALRLPIMKAFVIVYSLALNN